MEKLTLELPAMYGDHHVVEVRRILLEISGVEDVYASSNFHLVEVDYDPEKVSSDGIQSKLDEAGYLGDLTVPVEADAVADLQGDGNPYIRHSAVYETTQQVISFSRNVTFSSRPLWPCPGIGVIKMNEEA